MLRQSKQDQLQKVAGFCWQTLLILMAMEKRRAPLPISPRFLRACTGIGWPENPDDIAAIVERYLLRNDEFLVLRELRTGTGRETASRASVGILRS